jgi:hypothetical protein
MLDFYFLLKIFIYYIINNKLLVINITVFNLLRLELNENQINMYHFKPSLNFIMSLTILERNKANYDWKLNI